MEVLGQQQQPISKFGTRETFTVAFTRTFNYSWNIPDIDIHDLDKLSEINSVELWDLNMAIKNSNFSDSGNPILSMTKFQIHSQHDYNSVIEIMRAFQSVRP